MSHTLIDFFRFACVHAYDGFGERAYAHIKRDRRGRVRLVTKYIFARGGSEKNRCERTKKALARMFALWRSASLISLMVFKLTANHSLLLRSPLSLSPSRYTVLLVVCDYSHNYG